MDSLQSYGQENASHATNGYTISSIYHDGTLKIGDSRNNLEINSWSQAAIIIANHLDIVRACAFEFARFRSSTALYLQLEPSRSCPSALALPSKCL
jgi:hypothetical protein